jgi:hypothetical protein
MLKFIAICVPLAVLGAAALLITSGSARNGYSAVFSTIDNGRWIQCRWARSPRPPFDQRWRCF